MIEVWPIGSGRSMDGDTKLRPPAELHRVAKQLFAEIEDLDPERRATVLAERCGADSELLHEVNSLLANLDGASFLERPPLPAIAAAAAVDNMAGKRLGAYRILRRIGSGGMGVVYLAERADDQFRKRVALKAVRPGFADEHVLRRFENERQALAALDHPNIIKLLDAGADESGVPYLVMEYVEGQPIDAYCAARRLSVRERIELFRAVLGAVHYAHRNLVVHRDLKPGNILVTPDGVPKLLDFGIAKLIRPEFAAHMGLTRTMLQPMTPEYASPEQVLGQPVTTSSDIYSLGVILYGLLSGCHPFAGKTHSPLELERAICETDPDRPSRITASGGVETGLDRSLLRGDLDTIVLMAMRKEPQRRYPSAEHFAEDLRRYQEGRPVLARNAGPAYRASKFVGRHRVACVLTGLLLAGLVASGAVALREKRAAERRFEDLRQFANFMLNELDEKLRESPILAREALAAKSLAYLDNLASERASAAIQRDLVNGYIKNGEVQGNLYGASLGATRAAEASYRKALFFAQALADSPVATIDDRRNLMRAHKGLGEVLATTGRPDEALQHYIDALRAIDGGPTGSSLDPDAFYRLWIAIASAHMMRYDPSEALAAYRQARAAAEALPAADSSRKSRIALTREMSAYLGAVGGDMAGAEAAILESIAYYRVLVAEDAKPGRRRLLAKACKNLAEVRKLAGRYPQSLEAIAESEKITAQLLAEDKRSAPYQIDRQQAAMMEIGILRAAGSNAEARARTKQALADSRELAENPDAPVDLISDHAEILSTTPFPELRDDPAALRGALRALEASHKSDPGVWRVASLAWERNGNREQALEAAKRGLALLPEIRPGAPEGELRALLHAQVEALSPQQ